jgi:uncharacterized protein YciI
MPLFALFCVDKRESLPLRMANREAHLAYVRGVGERLKLAGPMLDEAGEMAGSILILEAADLAAARAFSAEDPYAKAGLFERVDITEFRPSIGSLR